MRVGKFSVVIPGGHERETGYVGLKDGAQYTIHILSHVGERADVDLTIDGRPIGRFRLNGHSRLEIEGPPDDPHKGRFTFYKSRTEAAAAAGEGAVVAADKGLIVCRFRPEYAPKPSTYYKRQLDDSVYGGAAVLRSSGIGGQSQGVPMYAANASFDPSAGAAPPKTEAGITGLSGHTDQAWQSVAGLDYDPSGETVINLRLVVWQDGPRPLPHAPLPKENPVPPPVG